MRVIFIHGNGTDHWSGAWCGWLKQELDKMGVENFFETFPDSIMARSEYWLPFLRNYVKTGEGDVLVGWSTGAVAAMRYAEENKIKGSILISPSFTDLGEESERVSGYFDKPWNWEVIKKNQEKITLVYGDDDPYISQEEFEFITSKLSPEVLKLHGAGHFLNQNTFPEIADNLKKNYLV